MDDFFPFFKKIWFSGILGPPYCGIGATIRIGREMLCLPYAGFFYSFFDKVMKIVCGGSVIIGATPFSFIAVYPRAFQEIFRKRRTYLIHDLIK